MFKNAAIFKFDRDNVDLGLSIEECLKAFQFVPCSATQDYSIGFVPPREANGFMLEVVGGQAIAKVMIETKTVPGSEIRKKAQEAADHIEATTGRKPGRKETKELREDARMALLPNAFARQRAVWIWFDRVNSLIVMDTPSMSVSDDVVSLLVQAIDGIKIRHLITTMTPQSAMTSWLSAIEESEWPEGIAIGRECELRSHDEEKAVIRFQRHYLLTDEVRKHIAEGKLPEKLAVEWDGCVKFILDDAMRLRKITFLDGVFDDADKDATGFDADVAIFTGEMSKVIPGLVAAMGGELVAQEGGAA